MKWGTTIYQQPNFVRRATMMSGLVEAHPSVLRQMGQPILGRFDPEFLRIIGETREMTKVPFATGNQQTFTTNDASRSGSEVGLSTLIEPDDKVFVPTYGRSAYLLGEICEHARAGVICLEKDWLTPFEQATVIEAIKEHQPEIVAMVHGGTASAQIQPLDQIGIFCRENEIFFVVDVVATYGGVETRIDGWRVDIAVAGIQRYVSVPSGLSLITYSQHVADYLAGRYQKELGLGANTRNERFIQSDYLDLLQLEKYWGPECLDHHTEATTVTYRLHEGLRLLLQEGMENVYARHRKSNRVLVESLQRMDLEIFGKLDTKTSTIIPVVIPEGIDGEEVRSLLLNHFKVEIASSFGDLKGKIWRVGNVGYNSREDNMLHFLNAFETILKHQGYQFEDGSGSIHALAEYLD